MRFNASYTLGWYESEFDGLGGYLNPSFLDMQPTTGDERHRLVLSGLGPLPFGFQLSGVAILATPTPFGVTIGQDLNNTGLTNDDWPDGQRTLRPPTTWDNMDRTVDLRLTRAVPVGDGRASVSAELFNVFNWTNWSGYSATMRDRSGNALESFGQPSGAYAPRQAQLGLRYEF
jgi:hypothetical protein